MMVLVTDGETVTQGSAPSALPQVNSATNQARMIGDYGLTPTATGWERVAEQRLEVENQLISNGMVDYGGIRSRIPTIRGASA